MPVLVNHTWQCQHASQNAGDVFLIAKSQGRTWGLQRQPLNPTQLWPVAEQRGVAVAAIRGGAKQYAGGQDEPPRDQPLRSRRLGAAPVRSGQPTPRSRYDPSPHPSSRREQREKQASGHQQGQQGARGQRLFRDRSSPEPATGSKSPPAPSLGSGRSPRAAPPEQEHRPGYRRALGALEPLGTGPPASPNSAPHRVAATSAADPATPAPRVAADPSSELACANFGRCSGCSLQDGLAATPLYGEAREFFRGLGLRHVPAVLKAAHGWRCRAKLAVRGPTGRPQIGLFREGTHECIDIVGAATDIAVTPGVAGIVLAPGTPGAASSGRSGARGRTGGGAGADSRRTSDAAVAPASWHKEGDADACRAHHPRINEAAALIKQLVTQCKIPPYNEPLPATGRAKATRVGRGAAAAAAAADFRTIRCAGGASTNHRSVRATASEPTADAGLLRYLQLTAVPSSPGGRAEEDPGAGVQVVFVVNASGDCDPDTDPRVRPILQLSRLLWHLGGPPGATLAAPSGTGPGIGAASAAKEQARGPSRAVATPRGHTAPGPGSPGAWAAAPAASQDEELELAVEEAEAEAGWGVALRLVHSIWLNFQPDASRNTVLGEGWRHVAGPAAAWQEFGGVPACVGPGSFVQANYGAMQMVLGEMADMVPIGSRVTELHAGIGAIGLSLMERRRLASLRCVEVNPAAAAPFRASLKRLQRRRRQRRASGAVIPAAGPVPPIDAKAEPEVEAEVEYLTAEAGSDPARFLSRCDVLVVDPPRKGLGESLLAALTQPTRGSSPGLGSQTPTPDGGSSGDGLSHPGASDPKAEGWDPGVRWQEGAEGGSEPPTGAAVAAEAESGPVGVPQLPSRLVYLSCGFRALQGDLKVLLAGGWRLRSATAYLFFPGTDSLETLVLLTRGEEAGG